MEKINFRRILIVCAAFFGGFALMAVELLYPRISVIWFGNILAVWAINLSMSLLIISIGYAAGSLLLKHFQKRTFSVLIISYTVISIYFVCLPLFYASFLDHILSIPDYFGAIIFSLIFMAPTMGLLAFSSPLLVDINQRFFSLSPSGTSTIFAISTAGGTISLLVTGLYLIPYCGIRISCYTLGALIFLNILIMFKLKNVSKLIGIDSCQAILKQSA